MSKKKIIVVISIIVVALIGILLSYFFIKKDTNKTESESKEESKDSILLKQDLKFEINSELKLLSLISEDNKVNILSDDETIDTSILGEKEITIKYEIDENEKIKSFKITIVDTEAPTIEYQKELSTNVGNKIDLLKDVKVSDNSKEEIKVSVEGNYDFNKEGTYNLKYIAVDSSSNKKEEEFILKVNKKQNNTTNNNTSNNNTSNNNTSNNSNSSDKKNNSSTNKKPDNTNNNNDNTTTKPDTNSSSNNKKDETVDNKEDKKYIGVADPNNFNYSLHHGVIEYRDLETCINDGYEVGFIDSKDIKNSFCLDVTDSENTILGYYLRIVCISGDCDKYKEILKKEKYNGTN